MEINGLQRVGNPFRVGQSFSHYTTRGLSTVQKPLLPFNIELLIPTQDQLKTLGQVTNHEIFEGTGGSFHPEGLFSTQIFGRLGTNEREAAFGYIHLGLKIFHPVIYKNLTRLRALYEKIMLGQTFVIFDEKEGDFVVSNEIEGFTGYDYFFKHFPKIKFKENQSRQRKARLDLIAKYKDQSILEDILIIPAGYREAEVDHTGRVNYDEVNDFYKKLLSLSFGVPDRFGISENMDIYNRKRVAMQKTVLEIYEYFEKLISGKKGFIQDKWAARRVYNGTRNVISSLDTTTIDLDLPNRPKFKDAVTGLHQTVVGNKHRVVYHFRERFINGVFDTYSDTVQLINPKTLRLEWVQLPGKTLDNWSTIEGNERLVDELAIVAKRARPIEIEGFYLALVYLDDKDNFKVFRDINELPEGYDKDLVRPITYAEAFYLSLVPILDKLVGFVTRYPVENYNSSFPVEFYVKTTTKGFMKYELGDDWERDPNKPVALEYPEIILGQVGNWHDSMSLSPAMLAPLGAD